MLVAVQDQNVAGVGMATLNGDIFLNYVHPEARFSGVSKAVIGGLEDALRTRGVRHCQLETTITARSFYEKRGYYAEDGNDLILTKKL